MFTSYIAAMLFLGQHDDIGTQTNSQLLAKEQLTYQI